MYKPVQAIEVRIWGKTAGAVALAPNLGYYAFEYDSRFLTVRLREAASNVCANRIVLPAVQAQRVLSGVLLRAAEKTADFIGQSSRVQESPGDFIVTQQFMLPGLAFQPVHQHLP